jgi:hypothetical protein
MSIYHDRVGDGCGGYLWLDRDGPRFFNHHDREIDQMMEREVAEQADGWILQKRKTKTYNAWSCQFLSSIHGRDMDADISEED